MEAFQLPESIVNIQGSLTVPIGDGVLSTSCAYLSSYSYNELLTPKTPHNAMHANKMPIHAVSTASYHELGGFEARFLLLQEAARETKGILMYSDQRGCGGDRTYSDGCAMIFATGALVAQGRQFSLEDVEVITAVVKMDVAEEDRPGPLQNVIFLGLNPDRNLVVEFELISKRQEAMSNGYHPNIERQTFNIEEQMAKGPACWLWDYLRRSNAAGFVVPLSGGIDSGCTATIVFSMCSIIMGAIQNGDAQVEADVQRVVGIKGWKPRNAEELCNRLLHTIYMGVSGHSSDRTRSRARRLAEDVGAHHTDMNIDHVFQAEKDLSRQYLGHTPTFDSGLSAENLALQNIQARIRMVTAYYFAQMLPTTRGRPGGGTLLVLGSINVEECLRGSLTKHDCSSADLSPIGSFSKLQIRDFIRWARTSFGLPILDEFLNATPSAELEPRRFEQDDFKDMGMTHQEISMFGKLRKESRLGPFSMFQRVLHHWRGQKSPVAIADLVKKFHHFYAINRHKMGTMTPAYHAGQSNPDDHRYDMRPMLYPGFEGSWSCKRIDDLTKELDMDCA
jgi:NAD+ synthase (glutamine-hydrolysing)